MSTNFHDLIRGFHNFKANTLLQEAEFFAATRAPIRRS